MVSDPNNELFVFLNPRRNTLCVSPEVIISFRKTVALGLLLLANDMNLHLRVVPMSVSETELGNVP